TPPPWLAADRGHLAGAHRVAVDIVFGVGALDAAGGTRELGASLASSNPVASMPSVHMALTVLVGLAMWGRYRALDAAAVLYVGAMALALVYLGEHYAVDLLAGTAIAGAAWWTVRRLTAGSVRYESP
ncbi:MAG: phosphatase PAP2 family protein, partial [Dehalococcoidia bacterium]